MDRENELLNSAIRHHRESRSDDAERICRQLLKSHPESHKALSLLALLTAESGNYETALSLIQKALQLSPSSAYYHNLFGHIQSQAGQIAAAELSLRRAIEFDPNLAEAYFNLGAVYQVEEKIDAATDCFRRALKLNPNNVSVLIRLGNILLAKKNEESLIHFERAVQIDPQRADARGCLVLAHLSMAALQSDRRETEKMFDSYRRALAIQPDHIEAHWNLSNELLRYGNLLEGWKQYEWRWKWPQFTSRRHNFLEPIWRGAPLNGARVLLHAEQGLGDTIQFVRYAPMVSEKGGEVILEVDSSLHRLLSWMPGMRQVIIAGERLPDFDIHCPLMSLPLAFGTTLETIPASVPYIRVDLGHHAMWKKRIEGAGFNVGLVWAGNPAHTRDRRRSIALKSFAPLAQAKGVRLFSLQKGPAAEEATQRPAGMNLIDWTSSIVDFADTAAIIAEMDLVISVDTSVAHLAGAMGKPTWILVPWPSDWRWMLDREDSPWYPTARLFRQAETEKWEPVIEKLISEFLQLLQKSGG